MPESGEWVGGGSFKIDREAALKKLAKFQLSDPARFLLAWIRAAAAGGASAVRVDREGSRLRFEAPSCALSVEAARTLMDALLSPAKGREAELRRQLALGMLALQRLDSTGAFLRSCDPLIIDVEADEATSTVDRACLLLASECAAVRFPVSLDGMTLPRLQEAEGEGWLRHQQDGRRVWLRPALDRQVGDRIAFAHYGVRAATLEAPSRLGGIDALVDDEGLCLDLSQASVLQDARYRGALATVAEARAILMASLATSTPGPLKAFFRDPASSYDAWRTALSNVLPQSPYHTPVWLESATGWRRWVDRLRPLAGRAIDAGPSLTGERLLLARRVAWLRAACRGLADGRRADRPGAVELWGIPLFVTRKGRTLSLKRLEAVRAKARALFVSPRRARAFGLLHGSRRPCPSLAAMIHLLQSEAGDCLDDEAYA